MKKTKEFYKGDIAQLLISNEGGKEVLKDVEVLDIKRAYGRVRYVVKPVSGKGEMTVEKLS